ncbi:MAG: AMP-dependent synthetase [Ruminococcaceae bacterium]|nr:AMP-dependent synthetase [Oscillospiraceae bacterium]
MKKTPRIFTPFRSFKDLISTLATRGDKIAFRFPVGKEFGQMTYAEFSAKAAKIAAGITAAGLADKRVALIGETSPEWVATYLGVTAAGGVIIPMDKELAVGEIEGLLAGVSAQAIVYSASFAEKFKAARENHPSLRVFVPLTGGEETTEEKVLPFAKLLEMGEKLLEEGYTLPDRDPDKLAIMLFTSGTTGSSKCVMLSEKNLTSCVNAACEAVNFNENDRTVSVLPLHHTYELAIMFASLCYGINIGINDTLRHLMRNFAYYKPTGLVLVPLFVNTMYKRIFDEARKKGKDKLLSRMIKLSNGMRRIGIDLRRKLFSSVLSAFGGCLEKIICGGAPLNPEMVKGFEAFGIQICEGYGITECSPLISVAPYFAPKSGSVGPAVTCCTARIAETGNKNDRGFEEGEIQVKGDNVMIGYCNNPEENAKAFTEDGWYRTGDVGFMDEDGYIYITGRLKSVIVLENGKNVFPEEIEEYLEKIEEIAECVVVGRKDTDGETVLLTAVVYPNKELFGEAESGVIYDTIYQKITELNKKLPSFKKLKGLELRESEFEKTTSRKIKRHLVK